MNDEDGLVGLSNRKLLSYRCLGLLQSSGRYTTLHGHYQALTHTHIIPVGTFGKLPQICERDLHKSHGSLTHIQKADPWPHTPTA